MVKGAEVLLYCSVSSRAVGQPWAITLCVSEGQEDEAGAVRSCWAAQEHSAYKELSQQHHHSLLEMLNSSSPLLCDCFMCFSQQNQSGRIDNL